jgi:hypothetical protein
MPSIPLPSHHPILSAGQVRYLISMTNQQKFYDCSKKKKKKNQEFYDEGREKEKTYTILCKELR